MFIIESYAEAYIVYSAQVFVPHQGIIFNIETEDKFIGLSPGENTMCECIQQTQTSKEKSPNWGYTNHPL